MDYKGDFIKELETKWQGYWEKNQTFVALDNSKKPKFYGLIEFPYPSGDGLHAGHLRPFTALDVVCRQKRLAGYNVLFPIGMDAFGLPTENYAIKHKITPQAATKKNIETFIRQLKMSGFGFDWSRFFTTADEDYYRWTQWIFIEMYKAGLAYKAKEYINWCTSCKIGLANEEVVGGVCERCGGEVVKREREQWLLKITKYADRLIDDLKNVDFLEQIKTQQINWIGKSEGAEIKFKVTSANSKLSSEFLVFTTRPDTLFGVTFMVVSPEHSIVHELESDISNLKEVKKYLEAARKKTDLERTENKDKSGIELKGIKVINPVSGEVIPIFVADYVLMNYGTGAIMAVPAHDQRDWEFAKKHKLNIKCVIEPRDESTGELMSIIGDNPEEDRQVVLEEILSGKRVYEYKGFSINSGDFNGLYTKQCQQKIIAWLEKNNLGKAAVNYKLHDWIFSRQRYWGEPIPMVYCDKCARKKPIVVLAHGSHGSPQENWFPWFKNVLESKGFKVIIPQLPLGDDMDLSEATKCLSQNVKDHLNEDFIIVGHSLGCPVVCNFIQKSNLKVKKLILVAPTGNHQVEVNWQNLKKAGVSDDFIERIKIFNKNKLNFSKLRKSIDTAIIYLSDNDPYISLDVEDDYLGLNARTKIFHGYGHFNTRFTNLTEFPEILEEFIGFENSGWQPVPVRDLPIKLPEISDYQPTDDGQSPLSKISDWVNTTCPKCGSPARRETDVMPNWAGSNWYFIRYADPKNNKELASTKKLKYWLPVDWYNGGMEHATLHLLYSRFIYKFLADIGVVPKHKDIGDEPYRKRTAQGMILGRGNIKMSKSKGNVVNPDDYIKEYGADSLRLYIMFMGPFDQTVAWDDKGVIGIYRFLNRVWHLADKVSKEKNTDKATISLMHKTIKKVSDDIDLMRFNTAVSQLMILTNQLEKLPRVSQEDVENLILLLSPFAPHISEELWQRLGHKDDLSHATWPTYDKNLAKDEIINLPIQINGKIRDQIELDYDTEPSAEVEAMVLSRDKVKTAIGAVSVKKFMHIKNKIISIVLK